MRPKPTNTVGSCESTSTCCPGAPGCGHIPPRPLGGVIAGGTAAGIVAVALGILGVIIFRNRRSRRNSPPPRVSRDRVHAQELPAGEAYTGYGVEGGQHGHGLGGKEVEGAERRQR